MVVAQTEIVLFEESVQILLKALKVLPQQTVGLFTGDAVGVLALLAGAAVADGILLIIPVRFFLEALQLLDKAPALFCRPELDVRVFTGGLVVRVLILTVGIDAVDDGRKLGARERPPGKICTVLVAVDDPGLVERLREVVRGVHEEVFRGLAFQMQRLCGELCNKAAQDGHIQIGDLAALQNALVKRQIEVPARPV